MAVQSPGRFVSNMATFVSFSKQLREPTISYYRRQDFEKTLMSRERAGGGETTEVLIIVHPDNFLKKVSYKPTSQVQLMYLFCFCLFSIREEEEEEKRSLMIKKFLL